MQFRRLADRWPAHPVAVALVVTAVLTVPLVIVSALLGRLPVRGGLAAAALLFVVSWVALASRSQSVGSAAAVRPRAAHR